VPADVEAMAACHHQTVDTHPLIDDRSISTADHADRGAFGEPAYRVSHAVGDDGVLWPVHDRRQCSIVVEEHRRPTTIQALGKLLAIA
jgi:hypothetical protein